MIAEQPRQRVGGAAGRERHDELEAAARIAFLRRCGLRRDRRKPERGKAKQASKQAFFHDPVSWFRFDLQGNIQQDERQRLAVAVEAEACVDAALQHVVEHEVEGAELGQVVAHHARGLAMREGLGDPLGGDLARDGRVVRRIPADQRDVEPVALVAGPRIGDLVELDGARIHAPPPSMVTEGCTIERSIRQEALASRGRTRRRTPAPPAGPAQ